MTDITAADLQNLTPEQMAALADQIKATQAAEPAPTETPAVLEEAPVVEPAVVAPIPAQAEAPINPVVSAVLNGVNTAAGAAQVAAPVVAAFDPPAGMAIEVAVGVLNALEAIAGYLGMVPEGMAKQGIQSQVSAIKQLVS